MISAEVEGPHPKLWLNVKIDDTLYTPIGHITFVTYIMEISGQASPERSKMD